MTQDPVEGFWQWINRLPIFLDLAAFFLVTPELIRESRLRLLEKRLTQGLPILPTFIAVLLWLTFVGIPYVALIVFTLRSDNQDRVVFLIGMIITALFGLSGGGLIIIHTRDVLKNKVIPSIVRRFADDQGTRIRFALLGAAIFVISKFLQFIASFFV